MIRSLSRFMVNMLLLLLYLMEANASQPNSTETTVKLKETQESDSRLIYHHGEVDEDPDTFKPNYEVFTNASSEETCPPLQVLDFLHFDPHNITQILTLEETWPCEVRVYWLEIQGLVSVVRFLFKYVIIIVVVFGVLVNLVSLCVLSSPPMSSSSITIYLRALALSDIGALLFNVTVGILRSHIQEVNNFYKTSGIMCFLHIISSLIFFYYSTWLVVSLTFERLVMIRSPFKGFHHCKFKPSYCVVVVVGCMSTIVVLLRSQIPGFETDSIYGYAPCKSLIRAKWNISVIPFLALTTSVPTVLIFIGNICLLLQIRRSAQNQSDLNASSGDEGVNTARITRMLMIVSITYLVLLLPVGIAATIELYWKSSYLSNKLNRATYIKWQQRMLLMKWIRGLCFFFYILNYNINFFLYCVSGKKFRETVKNCLKRWLPSSCLCSSLQRTNTLTSIPSQKHRISSTTASSFSLKLVKPRSSSATEDSEQGHHNSAFVNSETNTSIRKGSEKSQISIK